MKLDGPRLRARRLELGLTARGLAREAHISQTLIKRLEDTGELASVTCATLQHILDALSLDLVEILDEHSALPSPDAGNVERLGAILLGQTRGITQVALAHLLGISGTTVETQLETLAARLRPVGIRLHRGSPGIRLVPAHTSATPKGVRARWLETPTSTDLRLLHRALRSRLHAREVASIKNGNVSLHRLINSGLVEMSGDGSLTLGPTARDALQVDQS